ncbi:uncharacterized protein V1518DRAFT_254578 [Limtongia smithiae]|uniref:uncharacterized protein n=1 Tax=Limtongia smithiae TaxID=1125753 RepID=UPI0034CE178F
MNTETVLGRHMPPSPPAPGHIVSENTRTGPRRAKLTGTGDAGCVLDPCMELEGKTASRVAALLENRCGHKLAQPRPSLAGGRPFSSSAHSSALSEGCPVQRVQDRWSFVHAEIASQICFSARIYPGHAGLSHSGTTQLTSPVLGQFPPNPRQDRSSPYSTSISLQRLPPSPLGLSRRCSAQIAAAAEDTGHARYRGWWCV